MTDKSPQISQEEFLFYLNNRLRLAGLETTLANTCGEINGALNSQQAASAPVHYATMKELLVDKWLYDILGSLKNILPGSDSSSPRLLELNSMVAYTMIFIENSFPNRDSYYDVPNADKLIARLRTIENAIGDIRSLAEERLISSIGENGK